MASQPYDPYKNPSEWIGKTFGPPPRRDPLRQMFPHYKDFEEYMNREMKKWESYDDFENFFMTEVSGLDWKDPKLKVERPTLEEIEKHEAERAEFEKGFAERKIEEGYYDPKMRLTPFPHMATDKQVEDQKRQVSLALRNVLTAATAPGTLALKGLDKLGAPVAGDIVESWEKGVEVGKHRPPGWEPQTALEEIIPQAGSLIGLLAGGPGQIGGQATRLIGKNITPLITKGMTKWIGPKAGQIVGKALGGWLAESQGLGVTLAAGAEDLLDMPASYVHGTKIGTAFFLGKFANIERMPKMSQVFRQAFTRTIATIMQEYDPSALRNVVEFTDKAPFIKFDLNAISPQEWYNELLFTYFSRKKVSAREFFTDMEALKKEMAYRDSHIEAWKMYDLQYGPGAKSGKFIDIPGWGLIPVEMMTTKQYQSQDFIKKFQFAKDWSDMTEVMEGTGRREGAPKEPVTKKPMMVADDIKLRLERWQQEAKVGGEARRTEVEQRLRDIDTEIRVLERFRGQQPVEQELVLLENEQLQLEDLLKTEVEPVPPRIEGELDIAAAKRAGLEIPLEAQRAEEARVAEKKKTQEVEDRRYDERQRAIEKAEKHVKGLDDYTTDQLKEQAEVHKKAAEAYEKSANEKVAELKEEKPKKKKPEVEKVPKEPTEPEKPKEPEKKTPKLPPAQLPKKKKAAVERVLEVDKKEEKKKAAKKHGEKEVSPVLKQVLEEWDKTLDPEQKKALKKVRGDEVTVRDVLEADAIPDAAWMKLFGYKNKVEPLTPQEISLFLAKGGKVTVIIPKPMTMRELIEHGLKYIEYAKPQVELIPGLVKQELPGKKGWYRPYRQAKTPFEKVLHKIMLGQDITDLSIPELEIFRDKGYKIQLESLRGELKVPTKKEFKKVSMVAKPETAAEAKAWKAEQEKAAAAREATHKRQTDTYEKSIKEWKIRLDYLKSEKKAPKEKIEFPHRDQVFRITGGDKDYVDTVITYSDKPGQTGKHIRFPMKDVEKMLTKKNFSADIKLTEDFIKDTVRKLKQHVKSDPHGIQYVYAGLDLKQGLRAIGEHLYDLYADPKTWPKTEAEAYTRVVIQAIDSEKKFKLGYRMINNFRRMGKGGNMLADMADNYIMKRSQKEQNALYQFMKGQALVVAGAEKRYGILNRRKMNVEIGGRIYNLLEGKVEPANVQEEAGFKIIKGLMDEIGKTAIELDLDMQGSTGKRKFEMRTNYAPRMYRDLRRFFEDKQFAHLRDGFIKKIANNMFKGQPDAMEKAKVYFEELHDNLKSRQYGHLERERLMTDGELKHLEEEWRKQNPGKKFPLERMRTSESLIKYLVSAHDRLEWVRQFGQDIHERKGVYMPEGMAKAIEEMRDPANITYVKNSLKRYLSQSAVISPPLHRWMRAYRTANIAKLSFAFIPNSLQWFTNTIPKIDFKTAIETGWDTAGYYGLRGKEIKKQMNDFINKTGVNTFKNAFSAAMMENPLVANKWASFMLKAHGFAQTESFNAIFSGFAGKRYSMRLMNKLYKGRGKSYRSKFYVDELHKLGFSQEDIDFVIKNGPLTGEYFMKVADAAFRMRQATQFLADAFHLPAIWSTPQGRVITQFKNFALNQSILVRDNVKEFGKFFVTGGKQGDATKLMKMLPALWIAGNLIHKLKKWGYPKIGMHFYEEMLAGRSWPMKQLMIMMNTGGIGIAMDVFGAFSYGKSGMTSMVLGPAYGDLTQLADSVLKTGEEFYTAFTNKNPAWIAKRSKHIRDYWLRFGERLAPDVKLAVHNFFSDYKRIKEVGNWSNVVSDAYRKYKEMYMMQSRAKADKFWDAFMATQGKEYHELIGKWPSKPTYKQVLRWWIDIGEDTATGMEKRAPGKKKKTSTNRWEYDYWK